MKRLLLAAGVLALALTPVAAAGLERPAAPAERAVAVGQPRGDYVPGEVIVKFRAEASRAAKARALARMPARVAERFLAPRTSLMKLSRGTSVQAAVRAYNADPAVAYAEPNFLRYPDGSPPDPLYANLWGLNNTGQAHPLANTSSTRSGVLDADIDAPESWTFLPSSNPVVAVIDTGVDIAHPDLDGRIWVNQAEATGVPGEDDDGNGYDDDVNGFDFAENDGATLLDTAPVFPGYEHGTHVAGTIAGEHYNGVGVHGVCDACRIMVLKIADDAQGGMSVADEMRAISYAKANGASIVNMSLGGPDFSVAERSRIANSGLLNVVAAGNEALDNDMYLNVDADGNSTLDTFSPSYPAAYTPNNILTVGASNDMDENAYSTYCVLVLLLTKPECAFTNWGHDSVDVSAPGADIQSTVPGNAYATWDGTSMATPHVAGIAGLLLSGDSSLTTSHLKNKIMNSVDHPDLLKTLYMPSYVTGTERTRTGTFTRTAGRVNAAAALAASTANATPLTDGNINGAKAMRASASGSVAWPADINDVKKKKLRRGAVYRVKLVVPSGRDYDLYVWKPGTKEIWQLIAPGFNALQGASQNFNAADEVVKFVARSTGTYYIQVSAWLLESGSYKLTVKRVG